MISLEKYKEPYSFRVRLYSVVLSVLSFMLIACEHEKSDTSEKETEMAEEFSDVGSGFGYTSEKGDFLVDYPVEFFPFKNTSSKDEIAEGFVKVSSIRRISATNNWQYDAYKKDIIMFPDKNSLPLFIITDNLQIDDDLEGFILQFYDKQDNLLRTMSMSVSEWLMVIGECRLSEYGYLEINLNE